LGLQEKGQRMAGMGETLEGVIADGSVTTWLVTGPGQRVGLMWPSEF
jgi:hypothetical protein